MFVNACYYFCLMSFCFVNYMTESLNIAIKMRMPAKIRIPPKQTSFDLQKKIWVGNDSRTNAIDSWSMISIQTSKSCMQRLFNLASPKQLSQDYP